MWTYGQLLDLLHALTLRLYRQPPLGETLAETLMDTEEYRHLRQAVRFVNAELARREAM